VSKRLDEWLGDPKQGLIASFASGISQDHEAVQAALIEPCSNRQTEGQNTKLKLVKRQMYGRDGLDLSTYCEPPYRDDVIVADLSTNSASEPKFHADPQEGASAGFK
jgi:hypothetical protein